MPILHPPIGVFDSGIGGLSVLQSLRSELPYEYFVYLADSANTPYGERGDAFVQERTHTIARYLVSQHGIKALVIACNTATAAAVESLRQNMPQLPLIGVEPAIKPAARSTQTGHVGVMATRGTVQSQRFQRLLTAFGRETTFHIQACDGLARAIEKSTEHPASLTSLNAIDTEIRALCARYTDALGSFGLKTAEMDTLVLGCTHYIFAKDDLRALLGPDVQLVDTGAAVARQTRRLLMQLDALAPEPLLAHQTHKPNLHDVLAGPEQIYLQTTGRLSALQAAAQRWLQLPGSCCTLCSIAG